jgi:cellulose biosynthesis protein BcsQ
MAILQEISGTSAKREIVLRSVIGFISPTGGTGTTTIAASVAVTLAKSGYSVCYIDTNIVFPSGYLYLLDQRVYKSAKYDLLSMSEVKIKDIILKSRFENLFVLSAKGRKIIDMISPRDSQKQMRYLLEKCKSAFDFVILDVNTVPTELNAAAFIGCDSIYQIWDENPMCVSNCTNFMSYMMELGTLPSKILKVVINKRTNIELPIKLFNNKSLRLITSIPFSETVLKGAWRGKVIGEIESVKKIDTMVAQGINAIVQDMVGISNSEDTAKKQDIKEVNEVRKEKKEKKEKKNKNKEKSGVLSRC